MRIGGNRKQEKILSKRFVTGDQLAKETEGLNRPETGAAISARHGLPEQGWHFQKAFRSGRPTAT
jgi:hypothetical protein